MITLIKTKCVTTTIFDSHNCFSKLSFFFFVFSRFVCFFFFFLFLFFFVITSIFFFRVTFFNINFFFFNDDVFIKEKIIVTKNDESKKMTNRKCLTNVTIDCSKFIVNCVFDVNNRVFCNDFLFDLINRSSKMRNSNFTIKWNVFFVVFEFTCSLSTSNVVNIIFFSSMWDFSTLL